MLSDLPVSRDWPSETGDLAPSSWLYEKEAVASHQWPRDKPNVVEVDRDIALLKARRRDFLRSKKNSHIQELPTSFNKSRLVTRVISKMQELPGDSRFQELNGRLTQERMVRRGEEGSWF